MVPERTPMRPNRVLRQPATAPELEDLLQELGIAPPGQVDFELVSMWAAKHVWRVNVEGTPWAYIRYLLGSGEQFPDRWRHMRLGVDLQQAHVGPRILGFSEASQLLQGRAVMVEASLDDISREELIERADEVIGLFARLHSTIPLHSALSRDLTDADVEGLRPMQTLFAETRERWFEAVVERWLAIGLTEISELSNLVGTLINILGTMREEQDSLQIVVPAHNDPNFGNFKVNRKGALRLIDFEGLALSNPVADLGMFLAYYIDAPEDRYRLLTGYPLAEPDVILARMQVWVPLKYLSIAAHWAARLTRSEDEDEWIFAIESIEQWINGAAEMLFDAGVPASFLEALADVAESLLARWPFDEAEYDPPDS